MTEFVSAVDNVRGHVLSMHSGVVDVALFAENMWWTPEAVAGLVGQTTVVSDEHTGARVLHRITRAWKHDGMVCARLEPDGGDD